MPNFNNPVSTQGYLALLASIVDNNQATLKMLEGVTPLTNLPTNAKRWNPSTQRFEKWTGSAWAALTALYEMKVRNSDQLNGQVASFYLNAGNLNAGILPGARFDNNSHGNRGGGSLHAAATTSAAGFMSAADKSKLNGIEAGATGDMTAGEILAALLTVDGAGSGLDADLLDGWHRDSIRARANHTGTQSYTTVTGLGELATKNFADVKTECSTIEVATPISIPNSSSWYPTNGRYNCARLPEPNFTGGMYFCEIYISGAWRTVAYHSRTDDVGSIGSLTCDGTNMRFRNSGAYEPHFNQYTQKFNV